MRRIRSTELNMYQRISAEHSQKQNEKYERFFVFFLFTVRRPYGWDRSAHKKTQFIVLKTFFFLFQFRVTIFIEK